MWHENLLRYLKEFGVSKHQLAERSGLPYETVKRICTGKTANPYIDTLDRISVALGITLQDLLVDTKAVVGTKGLAELQTKLDAVVSERDLLLAENAILKDKNNALTEESKLLNMQLSYKDEIIALYKIIEQERSK